jgi:hypothetical protein
VPFDSAQGGPTAAKQPSNLSFIVGIVKDRTVKNSVCDEELWPGMLFFADVEILARKGWHLRFAESYLRGRPIWPNLKNSPTIFGRA